MEDLIPVLIYAGIGGVIVAAGVIFYVRAVASRKTYRCHNCGEEVRVELMEASHCNHCGTPLRQ